MEGKVLERLSKMRKGFTLLVVIILALVIIGGTWVLRGCGAQLGDNLIVNPLHSSSARIKVLTTYFASNETRNIYRVYATVIEDSDYATPCESGVCPNETFEIEDSFIDGNYRTADIFGELKTSEQTGKIFAIEMRGERSGISGTGSFRQIHSAAIERTE